MLVAFNLTRWDFPLVFIVSIMLPKSNLLSLVHNRAIAAVQRLEGLIWLPVLELRCEATPAGPELRPYVEATRLPLSPVERGTFWGRLFDQRWYRLEVPEGEAGHEPLWLNFEEQSEATLYIAGEAYFGFDVAHKYCRLPRGTSELWLESNCIQSAIWHPNQRPMLRHGAYHEGARLVRRDEAAWQGYHDLNCLVELMLDLRRRENPTLAEKPAIFGLQDRLESVPPYYRRLLRLLDQALDALDGEGVPAMRAILGDAYAELRMDKTFARCVATGHAHIDLVWLWPERMGELKAVHTFSTANRLMDDYPEFRFAYSQPASYEAVARREPRLFERVKERMRSGQWEATGAMYVESDTMMACGEALARSLEIGQAGFVELRGEPSPLVWLPDVFGYSACLPQIMRLTGVDYFFTTKMTWNAINRFPHSSFVWRGHDGSEVLAHVSQDIGYVCTMNVGEIKKGAYGHQQADRHEEFLMPTGHGDGGGGPTAEMCERARRLSALPTMPEIGWDHPEAFFQRLEGKRDALPVHQGECYLEYHRGTFTTHRAVKESFRALERSLQVGEAVAARLGRGLDLEHAWKRLIFSQFHDYIPGSSVWDVYEEGVPEARALVEAVVRSAVSALEAEAGDSACLFNPHGRSVRHALADGGLIELPPLSGVAIAEAKRRDSQPVSIKDKTVSNGLVTFSLDDSGHLTGLGWPEGAARIGPYFGALITYPDHAAAFDAWDIDRHVLALGTTCLEAATVTELRGGARAGFEVSRKIGQNSHARVRFLLEAGSPELQVEVDLDWREAEHLVKLYLPTGYKARNARFGAPFGSVLRAQLEEGPVAEAAWEVPYSRYLAVFEEGERSGLCVLSESNYGACVRDGAIGLSLVRSPKVTGREGHGSVWPAHLTRLENPPVHADLGSHQMRFVLGYYAADLPLERQPASLADVCFTSPLPYTGTPVSAPFEIAENSGNVVPAWVKPLANGAWLVRWHEVAGASGSIRLSCAQGWRAGVGEFNGECHQEPKTSLLVEHSPYQIRTVIFQRDPESASDRRG